MPGTLIISLDFELFWGMQDVRTLDSYRENILGVRSAISKLLKLFSEHQIHATWATVGLLFAKNAQEASSAAPAESERPSYVLPERSSYRLLSDPVLETESMCFFAPDLIRKIAETPNMEIASHTFSHYYCREPGQTKEQFFTDLQSAVSIAKESGFETTSLVLPRNQSVPEYNAMLSELGFTAFRDEENDWIHKRIKFRPLLRALRLLDVYFPLTGQGGYIPKKENGIWNLSGSRMYKPYFAPLSFMEDQKIRRIKKQMLHAAKNGICFHLWWHPHNIGTKTDYHVRQLEDIFSYYDELKARYGMRSMTMRELAEEMESLDNYY
jgi:hypothetical protein